MKKHLIMLPLLALALTSCGGNNNPSTSGESSSSSSSSSEPAWTGKTNADFQKAKTTYTKGGVEYQLNRNSLYKNQDAPHLDPMSKESHVMVVPFGFTDRTAVQTQANIDRIQKCFMGTTEEIRAVGGWESLASFYNKSSYGKTKFGGQVLPTWCVYEGTTTQFNGGGVKAAEYAKTWYEAEYAKANHGALGADAHPISWFDADNDGFLDLVWVVYSAKTVQGTDWWAYVTYTTNKKGTATSPNVKTLGWASIDWLDKGFGGYDPHTFIHETGHTFGLDDYYDYNGAWAPMGGVDFMDHNLGDHSMYSKFSLGWTAPLIVNDTARITLHPGTTTGDCFLLPSPGYNGTAFDEYMMVELMAPVGLAEQDYKNGYESTAGFSEPGIRITHVDARAYSNDQNKPLTTNPQDGIDVRFDNSKGGRASGSYHAYHDWMTREDGSKFYCPEFSLMESSFSEATNWTTSNTYNASNKTLFKKNARFNLKPSDVWAKNFMPSGTNLWNKAKTITSWTNIQKDDTQKSTIDETCTFNYSLKVISVEPNAEYGYEAVVEVTANAY